MSETFDRPIVIGYIAYDRANRLPAVFLGAGPAPTLQQMEHQTEARAAADAETTSRPSAKFSQGLELGSPSAPFVADPTNPRFTSDLAQREIGSRRPFPLIINGDPIRRAPPTHRR